MSDTTQRTNAFPKPPFPEQPQTPPGLASKMQPVPDH
ncbi:MAG: NAD(P)-dependent dehydrogenase, partial [Plesiomonas shigelloides]